MFVRNRIYNVVFGKDTRDFVRFRDLRFGLVPGPTVEEIEDNYRALNRPVFENMIDSAIQRMQSQAKRRLNKTVHLDDETTKKLLVYEVSQENSLKNIFARRSVSVRMQEVSVEDQIAARRAVIAGLGHDFINNATGTSELLFLGSQAYRLDKTRREKGSSGEIFVKLRKSHFLGMMQLELNIASIVSRYCKGVSSRIAHCLESAGVEEFLGQGGSVQREQALAQDEYYDQEHNIGFHTLEGKVLEDKILEDKVYAFTWTPSYVLKERVTGMHYRFPPAKVAVEIQIVNGQPHIEEPVVLNAYKHPGLAELDAEYQSICFMFYDKDAPKHLSTKNQVMSMLEAGCRMLMTNYVSDGHAYWNLENPDYAAHFRDLLTEDPGDSNLVTNLRSVAQYGMEVQGVD